MHTWQSDIRRTAALLASVGLVVAAPSFVIAADDAAAHDQHHSEATPAPKPDNSAVSDMMQQMQAMHAQMMAAKMPAERTALMQAHMALMQNGMNMMQGMHGSSAQRMDMMQMMMQMMMDRMAPPAPAAQKPDAKK